MVAVGPVIEGEPAERFGTVMDKPYYTDNLVTLYHGRAEDVLPTLPSDSIDTLITDPPAGISFMGKDWDHHKGGRVAWIAWLQGVLSECLRVCKPGASALVWSIPRTSHWTGTAIEESGWMPRDVVTHLFGSGFPKSANISKLIDSAAGATREVVGNNPNRAGRRPEGYHEGWDRPWQSDENAMAMKLTAPATDAAKLWDGWGTALKPAAEMWWLAMKPLAGTFAENAMAHGVAGLNIDGARIGTADSTVRNNAAPRFDGRSFAGGKVYAPEAYQSGSEGGRWPANVTMDEESAASLDATADSTPPQAQRTLRRLKPSTGWSGGSQQTDDAGDVPACSGGGPSRFFYTAKASQSDRGHGNTHPTVKPQSLMKWLCTLTATPTGGTVLDCFAGSGTTLVAARECGRPSIGIEQSEEYCKIIVDRLRQGVLWGAGAA